MKLAQVAIHTDGTVSCGAVLWRFHGSLQLTVVVKAVFAIVPDGFAEPAAPGEIIADDRHLDGSPFRSVAAASDLAPYLPRCDVLFTGHAHAPEGPVGAASVRIGVSRYGEWVLDKTIHVYGDRGPTGTPEPFSHMPLVYERAAPSAEAPNLIDPGGAPWPAGFGPISRLWSARRVLLGSVDPGVLDRPIPDLPEEMPWEYFQAAPPDQQIEVLQGGEWLVLEGLDPARARVQTRLPPARAVACIARISQEDEGRDRSAHVEATAETAVELACDTLAIDGDRQTFSLTWRGGYEVAGGEAALPSLAILAAMEMPGAPVDWNRVRAAPTVPARHGVARPRAMTVVASPDATPADAALPFKPSGLASRDGARPPSTDATPWATMQARAEPLTRPGAAPEAAFGFGLGMRLSSAPLGGRRATMELAPELLHAPPPSDEDEVDTVQPHTMPEPLTVPRPAAVPWPTAPRPITVPRPVTIPRPVTVPSPQRISLEELQEPPRQTAAPSVEASPPEPQPPVLDPDPAPAPPAQPVIATPWSQPPPPPAKPIPPPSDPWARPPEREAQTSDEPPPPPRRPPPRVYERPATAAMMGGFYSKFGRK